jgi:hypothetical protein
MPVFESRKTPTQEVVYEPDQWLKGTLQRSLKLNTFTLDQPVVAGTATADTKEFRLNPILFARGNRLILFLHNHAVSGANKPLIVATDILSADCDVVEATADNVAQVRASLK